MTVDDHFHFLQNSLLTQCAAAITEGFYLTTIPASVLLLKSSVSVLPERWQQNKTKIPHFLFSGLLMVLSLEDNHNSSEWVLSKTEAFT